MKIILDTKWEGFPSMPAVNAEITLIDSTILQPGVHVTPVVADDGTISLELLSESPAVDTVPFIGPQVVEVRGQYTYNASPSALGRAVKVGDTVDVEARNGGHWSGRVSRVWDLDDYLEDVDEQPTLDVLEIL